VNLLGDRPLGFVLENIVRPGNYRALANMPRRYVRVREGMERYFLGRGEYPATFEVRTPLGPIHPKLWVKDDMFTVNEVFCRNDYEAGPDAQLAVDIGSNIGISALYFLTRSPTTRVILFEPVPSNLAHLRENLERFADRYELHEAAVADRAGTLPFRTEPTGRYGGLDQGDGTPDEDTITVQVRHVNDVLEEILGRGVPIDVLKLDTEGSEAATVAAIRPDLLTRIHRIYCEDEGNEVRIAGWRRHRACETTALRNPIWPPKDPA